MSHTGRTSKTSGPGGSGKNYNLYALNLFGPNLNNIKDQYIKCVECGRRKPVFIIDLAAELAKKQSPSPRLSQSKTSRKADSPAELINVALSAIQRCRQRFIEVAATIQKEKAFDMYQYWLKDLKDQNGKRKDFFKALDKIPEKPKTVRASTTRIGDQKQRKKTETRRAFNLSSCPTSKRKEHHAVGRPEQLSKKKYIEDEPQNTKLYIILLGDFSESFLLNLLNRGEPLQAIVNCLPEENMYDLLVPQPKNKAFLKESLDYIRKTIYNLRKIKATKPVGFFQHQLPNISKCLAEKYSRLIFDELTWYFYDIDTIHYQYISFYFNAFNITNVEMSRSISIPDTLEAVASLSMQGQFLKSTLPAICYDDATVSMYLYSLIQFIDPPREKMDEFDILLLSQMPRRSGFGEYQEKALTLSSQYAKAFRSITKTKKYDRLFIEDNNKLLVNLIQYSNIEQFWNIYLTCLEYNNLRRTLLQQSLKDSAPYKAYDEECEPFYLPRFVKFFSTYEGVTQRLNQLLTEYDEYVVDEIHRGYKLYCFKRTYNELIETEKMIILPSRLCFRDFTLFQLEEFLRDCMTDERRQNIIDEFLKDNKDERAALQRKQFNVDLNIFIRPLSLKAKKLTDIFDIMFSQPQSKARVSKSKSSLNVNSGLRKNENFVDQADNVGIPLGLPPNHHLLKGYNLEDIRQEIFVKTSKYNFEEGFIQLYEERWCFKDMNKNMLMDINKNQLNIIGIRNKLNTGISKSIRLTTINNIQLRVLNVKEECCRIVINYPNGLTIYYEELLTEQIWTKPESFNDEHRRIYTCDGAIIIHYNMEDRIVILRYNGEVYRLYQYEFGEGEGEEEEMMMEDVYEDDLDDLSTPSGRLASGKKRKKKRKTTTQNVTIDGVKPVYAPLGPHDIRVKTYNMFKSATLVVFPSRVGYKMELEKLLEHELRFLAMISDKHNLTYLHLRITTTTGRIINVTAKGKMYEEKMCETIEWHDYFANESYAKRSDGVFLIWTHDTLKCFHEEGSVIITRTEQSIEYPDFDEDKIISSISESSSHVVETMDNRSTLDNLNNPVVIDVTKTKKTVERLGPETDDPISKTKQLAYNKAYKSYKQFLTGEGEEGEEDTSYVTYFCDSFHMQHKSYAAVFIMLLKNFIDDTRIYMEIFAADNLRVQVSRDDTPDDEELLPGSSGGEEYFITTLPDESIKSRDSNIGSKDDIKNVANIWVGEEFNLRVMEESLELNVMLVRNDPIQCKVHDALQLKFDFTESIADVFNDIISFISDFKQYPKMVPSKSRDLYFLEKSRRNCNTSGFEYFHQMPKLSKYSLKTSNCTVEFVPMKTMDEILSHIYEWVKIDLEKSPRFPKRPKPKPKREELPMVFSVNVFLQIPRLLQSTDVVHKFIKPFTKTTFKSLRHRFRSTLQHFMRPNLKFLVHKLISANSWKRRQQEHKRRLFIEQQRKGLYFAMLKHKVYPKYFQFMHEFGGHVKYINFFNFVRYQCFENPDHIMELQPKPEEAEPNVECKGSTYKMNDRNRFGFQKKPSKCK